MIWSVANHLFLFDFSPQQSSQTSFSICHYFGVNRFSSLHPLCLSGPFLGMIFGISSTTSSFSSSTISVTSSNCSGGLSSSISSTISSITGTNSTGSSLTNDSGVLVQDILTSVVILHRLVERKEGGLAVIQNPYSRIQ